MRITVTVEGRAFKARLEAPTADHVLVDDAACPECKAPAPLKVRGEGNHVEGRDTYAAKAVALCCGAEVGVIRARLSTIFGLEEDGRVLNGRARVY